MTIENELEPGPARAASPREAELEAKLNKRTLWMALFAFIAVVELIIMIEVVRQAGG